MFAHFRPIFICFLSLMFGIWLAELFREGHTIFFIVFICVIAVLILCSFLKFVFKNKFFEYLWNSNKFLIVLICSFLIGFGLFSFQSQKIQKESNFYINGKESFEISGRIRNSPVIYEDYVTFFLDDVSAQKEGKAIKLDKGIYVKASKSYEINALLKADIGDIVCYYGSLNTANVFNNNGVFDFAYKNDIRYFSELKKDGAYIKSKGSLNFIEKCRVYIKNTIYNAMDERHAGLCYAVFVGDLSGLDYDIISDFQITGVAHLLAVSGLNTSLMALVLVWLLRKLRLKEKHSILIVAILLFWYCLICNFCASVLRASLMSLLFLIGRAFMKQTDSLNSISLSGIILLLFNPLFVFDLSFLLSYACVFGMVMLGPVFYDMFLKMKLNKFISLNLSISLAAQIATLCFCVNSFGYISIFSLLTNLIIGPLMEYLYIAMFIALIIAMIIPFMWCFLWLCQWGLWLIEVVTKFISSWKFTVLYIDNFSSLFLVWNFYAMFAYSKFCILAGKRQKIINYALTTGIGVMLLVLNYTAFKS